MVPGTFLAPFPSDDYDAPARAVNDGPASFGKDTKDLSHVTVGGDGGLLRTAAILPRAQIGRVPVPPVVFVVCVFEVPMVLRRLVKESRKGRDLLDLRLR